MPVTFSLQVCQVLQATPRSRIVRLELGSNRLHFAAGQAVLIRVPGHAEVCAYSIAVAPDDVARDGSLELLVGHGSWDQLLRVGARVEVQGPVGGFTLTGVPTDRPLVFVAGGHGIAPLRSMIREALARGFQTISVVYSARTPQEFAYSEELSALATSGQIRWRRKVTRANDRDVWDGPRGRIDRHDLEAVMLSQTTHCFVCGPPGMVAAIEWQLLSGGVASDRIHIEAGRPARMNGQCAIRPASIVRRSSEDAG